METLEQEQNQQPEQPQLVSIELKEETLKHLNETRRWGFFLAILGFVIIGLMAMGGLSVSLIFSKFALAPLAQSPFPTYLFGLIYLVLALVYFFPTLYLFKFSTMTKKGIEEMNSSDIHLAFRNLKSLFRFIGIFTIVIISLYIVILLGVMIFSLMKAF